jgi:hypothetical protein
MTRRNSLSLRKLKKAAVALIVFPLLLPLVLIVLAGSLAYRALLYLLVWAVWLPKGKDILLVYSDSPRWHEYLVTHIFPLVQERAVVLNWSQRKQWTRWSLGVAVFRQFAGERDFNPLVVLFRPFRVAKIFRFWSAFKDWKDGYKEPVERLRQELFASL